MKKKVDFLIRYEHKVRELEGIMLLKLELEKRGYSVGFVANYDYKTDKRCYKPKVIVSPAIYWDSTLKTDLSVYGLKKKIANLLWEQVMGIEEEESPNGAHNITGTGQKITAFLWGENTKERLVGVGMPPQNAIVVGQINTDLLRGSFINTLKTKEELSKEFNLDVKKRWNLFVSSFAYCELDNLQKDLIIRTYGEKYYDEFTECSNKSREVILSWFESALTKYPNDIIIYRPHPDEAKKSLGLKRLEKQYSNFRVIFDYSLKHWIYSADKIYNWYSTGIIDAEVLNKPHRILRPYEIPRNYDYRLFHTANQIKTIQQFEEDYTSIERKEIINTQLLSSYYYLPPKYVYLSICDILEKMLLTSKYDVHYSIRERIHFGIPYLKTRLVKVISFSFPILRALHLFDHYFSAYDASIKALEDGYNKNVATEEEIKELSAKLKPIVYGEQI